MEKRKGSWLACKRTIRLKRTRSEEEEGGLRDFLTGVFSVLVSLVGVAFLGLAALQALTQGTRSAPFRAYLGLSLGLEAAVLSYRLYLCLRTRRSEEDLEKAVLVRREDAFSSSSYDSTLDFYERRNSC